MKKARELNQKELALILKARRGGLIWSEVHKLLPEYKHYHHLRWAMVKAWPQGLPPCGEFTYMESLVHLYKHNLLNDRHVYKVLGEQEFFESYEDRVKRCRQWYGLDFRPAISPLAFPHKRSV